MPTDNVLQHKTILVTRPDGLQHKLCDLLKQAGARPIHYAAIKITAPSDNSSREYAREHFADFDIATFISPTAVKTTLDYMPVDDRNCKLAAIGSRSQRALEQAGLKVSIQPQGHDSESLLQHPGLQASEVAGKNIVIFRGEDGRDVLAQELQKRGASVHYAAMYRRICPQHSLPFDTRFINSLDAITLSSNEGLQNLYDLAMQSKADNHTLLATPLCVPGQRAFKLGQSLGFQHIEVADNATDDAMFRAVNRLFSNISARD